MFCSPNWLHHHFTNVAFSTHHLSKSCTLCFLHLTISNTKPKPHVTLPFKFSSLLTIHHHLLKIKYLGFLVQVYESLVVSKMEPPKGVLASLWNFICFLPYFIGLLLLGTIKGSNFTSLNFIICLQSWYIFYMFKNWD